MQTRESFIRENMVSMIRVTSRNNCSGRSKARLISVMEIINRLRKSREVFIWIALFHPLLAQVYRRCALESIVFLEC